MMNNTEREAIRAEFEALGICRGHSLERTAFGQYRDLAVRDRWEGFKAARAAQPVAGTVYYEEQPDGTVTVVDPLDRPAPAADKVENGPASAEDMLVYGAIAAGYFKDAPATDSRRGEPSVAIAYLREQVAEQMSGVYVAFAGCSDNKDAPAADGFPEMPEHDGDIPNSTNSDGTWNRVKAYRKETLLAYARQAFEMGRQQAVPQGLRDAFELLCSEAEALCGDPEPGCIRCDAAARVRGWIAAAPPSPSGTTEGGE